MEIPYLVDNGESCSVKCGKSQVDGIFASRAQKILSSVLAPGNNPLNRIEVSENNPQRYCSKAILFSATSGQFMECAVYCNSALGSDEIRATRFLHAELGLTEGQTLDIFYKKDSLFSKVLLQNIDNISEKSVYIAPRNEAGEPINIDRNFGFYELYNTLTGASLTLPTSKIFISETLGDGEIRMSWLQRELADIELPQSIDDDVYEYLAGIKGNNELKKILGRWFFDDGLAEGERKPDVCYNDTQSWKTLLFGSGLMRIAFSPVIASYKFKRERSVYEDITRVIVGKSIATMRCIRPYNEDEDNGIVRISSDNMKVLGISDMDVVKITYRTRQFRCKALAFDSLDRLNIANKKVNEQTAIGIPSDIRKRLLVCDLHSTVKVERDTRAIFAKNISKSLISTLLTLYGAITIFYNNMLWALLGCLFAIPLIIYAMFSEQRSNRGVDISSHNHGVKKPKKRKQK